MCWAEALERGGFRRDIAGDVDFDAAVKACELAFSGAMTPSRPTENEPRKKGVIVSGEYGVGKSCLVRAIAAAFRFRPRIVDLADSREIGKLDEAWMDYNSENLYATNVVLDDLGAEKPQNDYGIRFERAGEFIANYHARGKGRLIISTNLTTAELDSRYGGRVLSRLKDLCVPLRLTGRDKRVWTV